MRVAILAGLIVVVSLAFQSAHAVHTRAIVGSRSETLVGSGRV